ncbi:hypothetical protein BN2476_10032 [Paraburkholderia piptadeniae]|uniref:Uncharacterized protein n=1 Tax=Paraburkholderia piptadeniae TaxID=1701573 RepID=A0A1N7RIU6_9BURK|nr:hypothetical protein BN2476_10032 [Paraburkholderia piptadeniae]
MSLEREVLTDRTEARQECLGALRNPETAYPTLAFPCGLMTVFGPVVHPGAGLVAFTRRANPHQRRTVL